MSINYSIIIPHKNIPELLIRCINSIPMRGDIQIIVVDDNSDNAESFVETYPDFSRENLELILTNEGRGAGYARNIGLKKVVGKWTLFADSDDFFLPGWLDVTDQYLNSEADVIQFRIGDIFNHDDCSWHNSILDRFKEGKMSARDVLFGINTCIGKMLRSEFIRKNGLMFEEVRYANDFGFGVKIAVNASTIDISQFPIYDVTFREGSLTTIRSKESLLTRYTVQKRAFVYAAEHGYKKCELPCAIEFLIAWRKRGIKEYLSFLWHEKEEIKSAKRVQMENKPFNYRHPYLYSLLVLLRLC